MILHDSAEFKRSFHIAKFFVAIFFAMLGICFETTKFFPKNEKKQGLFRLMAYSSPCSVFIITKKITSLAALSR